MQRERVTENIYVFTSDQYVQVTSGAIITSDGAVLIDTLLYPEETRKIKRFVEERLGTVVRYVVNTHYHADHTMGTYLFEGAHVIAHRLCRELLDTRGRESLEQARQTSEDMQDVRLVLPDIVFEDRLTLHIGSHVLQFWHSPGHSMDSIACLVEDEQVLFAADTAMPIPYFVDGDFSAFRESLRGLQGRMFETIVQGHGEVVLRGEIPDKIKSDIAYLEKLEAAVDRALNLPEAQVEDALAVIQIEDCGKDRILLQGAVRQLHDHNVRKLAAQKREGSLLQAE